MKRNAFTLIELVIVMVVLALIASLTLTVLMGMIRHQAAAERQVLVGNNFMRLGDRFRSDVQASTSAEVDDRQIQLQLADGRKVVYQHEENGMLRRAVESDSGGPRHDHFDVPSDHQVTFSQPDFEGGPRFISLSIESAKESRVDPVNGQALGIQETKVVAELGRDLRWNRPK